MHQRQEREKKHGLKRVSREEEEKRRGSKRKNKNCRMSMAEEVVVCKSIWKRDIARRKMKEECRRKCNIEGEGLGW